MPRQLRECLLRNANNFNRIGPGGQGVEPPVRIFFCLALGTGGIKVRLGKLNIVFSLMLCCFPEFETSEIKKTNCLGNCRNFGHFRNSLGISGNA